MRTDNYHAITSYNKLKKLATAIGLRVRVDPEGFVVGKPKASKENCYYMNTFEELEWYLRGYAESKNKDVRDMLM